MSSTADLRSRSGRPVDDDDLCTAVTAVEPMRDLLEGLPHLWGPSPLGTPQFGEPVQKPFQACGEMNGPPFSLRSAGCAHREVPQAKDVHKN